MNHIIRNIIQVIKFKIETFGRMTAIVAIILAFMLALSAPALIKTFGRLFAAAFVVIWNVTASWLGIIWYMLGEIF
jgi:hypothetical protein